jgi:hypothetical protein
MNKRMLMWTTRAQKYGAHMRMERILAHGEVDHSVHMSNGTWFQGINALAKHQKSQNAKRMDRGGSVWAPKWHD